jgi:hypothetical protein
MGNDFSANLSWPGAHDRSNAPRRRSRFSSKVLCLIAQAIPYFLGSCISPATDFKALGGSVLTPNVTCHIVSQLIDPEEKTFARRWGKDLKSYGEKEEFLWAKRLLVGSS